MPINMNIFKTFISMINTKYQSWKAILFFMSSCNFMLSLVVHEESFINSGHVNPKDIYTIHSIIIKPTEHIVSS